MLRIGEIRAVGPTSLTIPIAMAEPSIFPVALAAMLIFACLCIVTAVWIRPRRYALGVIATLPIGLLALLLLTFSPSPRTGISAVGGTRLVYQVQEHDGFSTPPNERAAQDKPSLRAEEVGDTAVGLDRLAGAINRRVNPSGTREVVVRPFGGKQVEIIVPEVERIEIEQIKKIISTAGVLEFRILANPRDHLEIIALAEEQAKDVAKQRNRNVYDAKGKPAEKNKPVAVWARVAREAKTMQGVRPFKVNVSGLTVRSAATGDILRIPPGAFTGRDDDTNRLELAKYFQDRNIEEIDVLMATNDGYDVNGSHMGAVSRGFDEYADPCIHFSLKGDGVPLFSDLTGDFAPDGSFHRQLGIVLDNVLLSAPNIQERITGQGRITGQFTQQEVDFLVNILQAGSLPMMLDNVPAVEEAFPPDPSVLETMRTVLLGSLAASLFLWVSTCLRCGWLGAGSALSSFVQLALTLAVLLWVRATFTLSFIIALMCVVLFATVINAVICACKRREAQGDVSDAQLLKSLLGAVPYFVLCSVPVVVYALGGFLIRNISLALVCGGIAALATHGCMWVFPDLVAKIVQTISRVSPDERSVTSLTP